MCLTTLNAEILQKYLSLRQNYILKIEIRCINFVTFFEMRYRYEIENLSYII